MVHIPRREIRFRAKRRIVGKRERRIKQMLHMAQLRPVRTQAERDWLPFPVRRIYRSRQIMIRHSRESRHYVRIAEDAVQLNIQIIGAKSDRLAVRCVSRDKERHLLHQRRVALGSQEKRIQHHVTGHFVHPLAVHIHRQRERGAQRVLCRERRRVEMAATEIEIHLRITLAQVDHAVKRHFQMRVVDCELTLVSPRLQRAIDTQIRIGVVIIRDLPRMRLHLAGEHPFVNLSFGGHIQRHLRQFGHIQHLTQPEIPSHHACVILHVFEKRIGAERAIRRNGSEGCTESAVESQIM